MTSALVLAAAGPDGSGGEFDALGWIGIGVGLLLIVTIALTIGAVVLWRRGSRTPPPTVPPLTQVPPLTPPGGLQSGPYPAATRPAPPAPTAPVPGPTASGPNAAPAQPGPPDPAMALPTVPIHRPDTAQLRAANRPGFESVPGFPTALEAPEAGAAPSNPGTRTRRPAPPVRVSLSPETRPIAVRRRPATAAEEFPTGPLPIVSGPPAPPLGP